MLKMIGKDRNSHMTNPGAQNESLVGLTASIVSANVSNSPLGTHDLCDMILSVHSALSSLASVATPIVDEGQVGRREPAVPIEKSIEQEFIICLEDGKKLKTLKRYLRAKYQMSPEDYRAKWGLPLDYPMAAPSYLEQRRKMAHKIGLGLRPKSSKIKSEAVIVTGPKDAKSEDGRTRRRKAG